MSQGELSIQNIIGCLSFRLVFSPFCVSDQGYNAYGSQLIKRKNFPLCSRINSLSFLRDVGCP